MVNAITNRPKAKKPDPLDWVEESEVELEFVSDHLDQVGNPKVEPEFESDRLDQVEKPKVEPEFDLLELKPGTPLVCVQESQSFDESPILESEYENTDERLLFGFRYQGTDEEWDAEW